MPYYNLRRLEDHKIFPAVCANDEIALHEFGKELGLILTLKEGLGAPDYMMGRRAEPMGWIKTDIPVFVVAT
jgi:hypothetical protein